MLKSNEIDLNVVYMRLGSIQKHFREMKVFGKILSNIGKPTTNIKEYRPFGKGFWGVVFEESMDGIDASCLVTVSRDDDKEVIDRVAKIINKNGIQNKYFRYLDDGRTINLLLPEMTEKQLDSMIKVSKDLHMYLDKLKEGVVQSVSESLRRVKDNIHIISKPDPRDRGREISFIEIKTELWGQHSPSGPSMGRVITFGSSNTLIIQEEDWKNIEAVLKGQKQKYEYKDEQGKVWRISLQGSSVNFIPSGSSKGYWIDLDDLTKAFGIGNRRTFIDMGESFSVVENSFVINKKLIFDGVLKHLDEKSEVSFSITTPINVDPDDLMSELNDDYAEGNNYFEHIDDVRSGGKRVVTVVYNPKGNAKSWADKVAKSLKKDSGYEVDYVIN